MPMAARLTDMHTCPMVTVLVPHVGGPITGPGEPTVAIGGLPAAVFDAADGLEGFADLVDMGVDGFGGEIEGIFAAERGGCDVADFVNRHARRAARGGGVEAGDESVGGGFAGGGGGNGI